MLVLFVEDDPMNRSVVRDMLAVVDVAMAEAEDAEQGLRMIDEHEYDAVLMDLRMPGMDGLTAVRQIRARGDAKARLPVVVITADAGDDLRRRCGEAGADDVLSKPVPMDALFDTLGELIERDDALIA